VGDRPLEAHLTDVRKVKGRGFGRTHGVCRERGGYGSAMGKPKPTLDQVIEILGDRRIEHASSSYEKVDLPWDLGAEQYLSFARTDSRQRGRRAAVNALGNAKRALHCQIDSVLFAAGFWSRSQERRWDFHAKTELLAELQIATPKVLGRINRLRNQVEHGYSAPEDLGQLEDFIDVVELFIAGTRRFARSRWTDIEFIRRAGRGSTLVRVRFDGSSVWVEPDWKVILEPRSLAQFRKLQVAIYQAAIRGDVPLGH
jgi:hypothetical protein